MRVLLDVSWLGLGHLYAQSRSGSFRANQHLAEALVSSGDCEVLLCANCSSVAFAGCVDYLRLDPVLGRLRLLGPVSSSASTLRRLATTAHGALRRIFPNNSIPGALRAGARLLDQRAHPPVSDSTPPTDVFHSFCVPLPPRSCRSQRRLLTLYDVVHPRYADLYDQNRIQSTSQAVHSLTAEDWVVTSSEATRADLVELGIAPEERVFVTPLAAEPTVFYPRTDEKGLSLVRQRLGVPPGGPYLLAVGVRDVRKNLEAVVRAFAAIVRQERTRDLTLVLAGPPGPGADRLAGVLDEARAAGARIVVTGFVSDEDLAVLYSGATALVIASLHEGFGLPVLEAMRCGTPVIVSNRGSLPEVSGDAAVVVDPADLDALAQSILDVFRDSSLRERLRARGLARSAEFTWERSAEKTLAAYRSALAA